MAQPSEADNVTVAQAAAQAWLAIVDAGRYGESWDQAASGFKSGVTKERWEGMAGPVRKPLGAVKSRTVKSAKYSRTLPNAPPGEYVLIVYDSSFDGLPAANETVAMTRDKDGKWRAGGYYIRPAPPGPSGAITDEKLREALKQRIDVAGSGVGIVVGIIDEKGQRVIAYGKPARESAQSVDGDTVFEIGSITKVFTGLILADMIERGEVALDDPVSRYLPASVKVPRNDAGEITLRQLATHTSGLPRMPNNFSPADANNPYADYTAERMYAFLASYDASKNMPFREYSNLGFGLLGVALARRAGTDYETLLRTRVLEPLGMKDTAIHLTGRMLDHRASGYREDLQSGSAWDFDAFAGAGAIRSTINDMLKFAAAELGLTHTPLDAAIRASQRPAGGLGKQGIAWVIQDDGRLTHDGMTGAFASEIALNLKSKKGVVTLSNTASPTNLALVASY
jgi:CubicO group peptidase (beta-lactamase class C family)